MSKELSLLSIKRNNKKKIKLKNPEKKTQNKTNQPNKQNKINSAKLPYIWKVAMLITKKKFKVPGLPVQVLKVSALNETLLSTNQEINNAK